jgi:REP element-mobilizing transposase RayT
MQKYDLENGDSALPDLRRGKTKNAVSSFESKEDEVSDSNQDVILEPIHSESYDLSYTCLLIPRFPSHQIKGDLAAYLPQWLQQICISYSWQLEFTSPQQDFFQWALRVNASVPPVQFMQAIRYETSKFILSNFGHIARENLSNDFWAPGHLVVLGIRPHPKEMIEQYIRLTRRQQGLNTF